MNRNNWLSNKPSTRVHHAPGGNSSFSLGFGTEQQQPAMPANAPQNPQFSQPPQPGIQQKAKGVQQAAPMVQFPLSKNKCHATAVRDFNRAAGHNTPNTPQLMNRLEVEFITKMVLDELLEFNATVMNPFDAKASIMNMLKVAKNYPQMQTADKAEILGAQANTLVDIWYNSLSCGVKKGINLSSVFDLVHNANMRKINPATGMCIRRADGKIEEPQGWCPPNVAEEIQRQATQGSFH